jgi:protein O-GlcNAc transferase
MICLYKGGRGSQAPSTDSGWRKLPHGARRLAASALLAAAFVLALSPQLTAQGDALRRGLSLIKASQPAQAEKVLVSIQPSNADYCAAQTMLGFLFLNRAALPEAEKAFRIVLNVQPDNAQARLGLGSALLSNGSVEEAGAEFAQIVDDPAVGLKAQTQQIRSLLYAGRAEEGFRMARRLSAANDSIAELHGILGFSHQLRFEYREALEEYLRVTALEPNNPNARIEVISLYRRLGDWNNALRTTRQALELDANSPLLYQNLAAIYERLGKSEEARLAQSQAELTYDAELLYTQAAKFRAAGQFREAKEILREAIRKNPRLSKACCDLGELFHADGNLEEACAAFRQALEAFPKEARAVVGLATALRDAGKWEEALRYCRRALADGLDTPDVLAAMANLYQEQGKTGDAVGSMTEAVRRLPDNPDLLCYLGYLQQTTGNATEARASYAMALRLHPQQVHALVGQARSLLSQGDTDSALTALNIAKTLRPKDTEILKVLIEAYIKAGAAEAAEAMCRECLAIDPADFGCREQMASLMMDRKDYAIAAAQFREVLRRGRTTKAVLDNMAYALMKLGEFDVAIEMSERSISMFGADLHVYETLAYLHRCRGDMKRALAHYRLARDAAPEDPERNYNLGLALYLASDFSTAVVPLQAAVRLKPDYGSAHYYLALVYWNLKQYAFALASGRRAQELGVPAASSVVQTLDVSRQLIRKAGR